MFEKRIVVVGGSIAGCAVTALLQRLGLNVVLLERSVGLTNRGAGITLPESLVQQCIELNLFDPTIPHLTASSRSFSQKDGTSEHGARQFWRQSLNVVTLNWQDVYQNLYRRIDSSNYHNNTAVQRIHKIGDVYQVETSTGVTYSADLIIAADGIDSTIRAQILPDCNPEYTGYIAWRGLVNEPNPDANPSFEQHIPYYVFPQGHLLLYRIPANNYQESGQTQLNWVFYENHPGMDPNALLIDKDQKQHTRSLPAGSLSQAHIGYLHELATRVLPSPIATLIQQTQHPFLQAVFDFQLPSYQDNQMIFVGDAASTLRPHTASGVLKALTNGIALTNLIEKNQEGTLTDVVKQWQMMQQSMAIEETAKAKSMGAALVTDPPHWDTMNQESMDAWWTSLMHGKTWYATSAPSKLLNHSIFPLAEIGTTALGKEEDLIKKIKK